MIIKELNEGFNLTYKNGIYYVEMTDKHQQGIDTTVHNNPCKSTIPVFVDSLQEIKHFPVISMFTRKQYNSDDFKQLDGNPVLYALKNEKNYKFKSNKDLKFIKERFIEIFNKHFETVGHNITIISPSYNKAKLPQTGVVVPTTSIVNQLIVDSISSVAQHITFIDKAIRKMTTDEIYDLCADTTKHFYRFYKIRKKYTEEEIDDIFDELETYLDYMDDYRNGFYCKHDVKNQEMRKHIINTLQISADYEKYNKDINNRDILLIDDTLTYGQTIQQCINILLNNYKPKSITVLTMFSAKQYYS